MKKPFVSVTDTTMTTTEIISLAKRCGADRVCFQRFGVQFFNNQLGYYTKEQITEKMEELRSHQTVAERILSLIPSIEGRKIAAEELRSIFASLSCEGIMENILSNECLTRAG